jgi:hypothetical protein
MTDLHLDDPMWRLHNLYYIIDKRGQRVRFEPNQAQLEYLQECTKSDLILKARQLGFTTLMCLIGLDEALFLNDHNVGIIAHTKDDAIVIFDTKVKYPYDNLPAAIRERRPASTDRAGMLKFDNNSSIRVATSARSGTLQRLHVSEFGKICATYPKKAREIVTGSFPAVGKNPKTIESTAEGQEGYFYEYAEKGMRGAGPFKFHFRAWWQDPGNVWTPDLVNITAEDRQYFRKLKVEHGIELTERQMAWWVREEELLGGDMKRENPSTAEEAFEQAIEGAYFANQLAHADKHGHIGAFPYDPMYPVNTFWDLGRNDSTTIWFHQEINKRNRFIGYYENSGEHISHYADEMAQRQRSFGWRWGTHYWPHDGKREDLFLENGRQAVAEKLDIGNGQRLVTDIVERPQNKLEAIAAGRTRFASCDFDETECDLGIKRLRHFRKEWDDMREVWRDRPRHDQNSHGADGYLTFACGYEEQAQATPRRKRTAGWAA